MDRQPNEAEIQRANRVERVRILHVLHEECRRQHVYDMRDSLEAVQAGIGQTLEQRSKLLNAVTAAIKEDPEIIRDSVVQSILRHFHIEPNLGF